MNVMCGEYLVTISYWCVVKITSTRNPLRCKIASWVKHFHPPTLRPLHTWGTSPRQTYCVSVEFFFIFLLAAFHHFMLVTSLRCQTLICVVRFQEIIIFPPGEIKSNSDLRHFFSDGFVDSTTNKLWHWQFQWVTRHPHPSLDCHLWPNQGYVGTPWRGIHRLGFKIRVPKKGVLEICEGHLKSNKKSKQPNSVYCIVFDEMYVSFSFLIFNIRELSFR